MRIKGAEVSGFGALKDLQLTFSQESPVILLYGRNEAGKSTLMHFIRAVLFGFASRSQPHLRYEPEQGGTHGGMLECLDAAGRIVRIQRYDAPGPSGRRLSAGNVTVTCEGGQSGGEELLKSLIGDLTSDIYNSIFAFGLSELEEVRTLHKGEISAYLYHTGFGASGSSILEIEKRIVSELDNLFKPKGQKQMINQLGAQLDELDDQLRRSRSDVELYHEISGKLDSLREQIADVEEQISKAEERSLWIDACLKAREPWQTLCMAEDELGRLPEIHFVPEDSMERFVQEKQRLDDLQLDKKELEDELFRITRQVESLEPNERLLDQQDDIVSLFEHSAVIRSMEAEQQEVSREMIELNEQINVRLKQIDERWTEQDVMQIVISLTEREEIAHVRESISRLQQKLEACDAELIRLEGDRKRLDRRKEEIVQDVARAKEELISHYAGNWMTWSFEERRKKMQELDRALDDWRQAEVELSFAEQYEEDGKKRRKKQNILSILMMVSAVISGVLFVVLDRIDTGIIAGAVLAIMSLVSYFLARGQTAGATRQLLQKRKERDRAAGEAVRLLEQFGPKMFEARDGVKFPGTRQTRNMLIFAASAREESAGPQPMDGMWTLTDAQAAAKELENVMEHLRAEEMQHHRLEERLADIEDEWKDIYGQYQYVKEQRSEYEAQLHQLLDEWRSWLAARGLPANLMPETATGLLSVIEQIKQMIETRNKAQRRLSGYMEKIEQYETRVRKLCEELEVSCEDRDAVHDIIRKMADEVSAAEELARHKKGLQQEQKKLQSDLEKVEERIQFTSRKIHEIWAEIGAGDEADYRKRMEDYRRRRELLEVIEQANARLSWLVTPTRLEELKSTLQQMGETELDAKRLALDSQLKELRTEIDRLRDERAKLEVELAQLLDGTVHAEWTQQREELESQLQKHVEQYLMYAMARELLRETRDLYERERQPKVLQRASHFLSTITGGRYVRVMAPFGEQKLVVERADGRHIDTGALSRGTAEQLYLAMRFALVEAYSAERDPLPIILDDILVNVDEERAVRCLEVIREVANRHQILMFTCHDYMRQLVTEKLPDTQMIELDVKPVE